MSINTLLTAMETEFKAVLTGAKTVEIFPGPFTPDLVMQRSFSSPALFFGVSNAQNARPEEAAVLNEYGLVMSCRFTGVVVAKHAKSHTAAASEATMMAEMLCATLYNNKFGQSFVSKPYQLTAEPIAAGSNKQLGHLSFWRVNWWQAVAMNAEALQAEWAAMEDFNGYDADHFWPGDDSLIDVPKMQSQETYDE
jgi:hypothetical protein